MIPRHVAASAGAKAIGNSADNRDYIGFFLRSSGHWVLHVADGLAAQLIPMSEHLLGVTSYFAPNSAALIPGRHSRSAG